MSYPNGAGQGGRLTQKASSSPVLETEDAPPCLSRRPGAPGAPGLVAVSLPSLPLSRRGFCCTSFLQRHMLLALGRIVVQGGRPRPRASKILVISCVTRLRIMPFVVYNELLSATAELMLTG